MAEFERGTDASHDDLGEAPEIGADLEVTNRSIKGTDQAYSVCDALIQDFRKGIAKSARVTAKVNGERPYNEKGQKDAGKAWKSNISTGFLGTECNKLTPRFYMPIKSAKYLTAAELPAGHPNGPEKTQHFRQTVTDAVRSWRKFNFYIRGLAKEVATYGFAFNVWFDEYDWRPNLVRQDRGFVPAGTELTEDPPFFMAKWDYKPNELLDLLRANVEAGRSEWDKDNVVDAIKNAYPVTIGSSQDSARTYEDLVRQASWGYSYSKKAKVVSTYHLFAKEASGKVSHYVLLASKKGSDISQNDRRLLYENLDQYESMADAVQPTVFDYGDGTIHGSWGAGQILYDLAVQVEKVRNDSIDNIRTTNKVKAHVPDAKNMNDVRLVTNDQFILVSGAQMAGNAAGMTSDVEGYELLDQKLTRLAQEKIGAFVPPIPLQPSDIKAAQINAALSKEKELQEALLENWLIQWADVMRVVTKRLCNPGSPDDVAKSVTTALTTKETADEIKLFTDQFPVKSVMDFTEYKAQQRAAFAASVQGSPLFRQSAVARVMAEGVGDDRFIDEIAIKEGDQSEVMAAQREQLMESAAMANGDSVPVLPSDNDWVHMQTLKPRIQQRLVAGGDPNVAYTERELRHYAAHWEQGVNKKTIPKDQINDEKQWIAGAEKNIGALKEQAAVQQQQAQAQAQADATAQALVQSGQA